MTGTFLSGKFENMGGGTPLFVCLLIIAGAMEGVRINLYLPRPYPAGLQDDVFKLCHIFTLRFARLFSPALSDCFFRQVVMRHKKGGVDELGKLWGRTEQFWPFFLHLVKPEAPGRIRFQYALGAILSFNEKKACERLLIYSRWKYTTEGIWTVPRALLCYLRRYFCSGQRGQKIAISVSRILTWKKCYQIWHQFLVIIGIYR